MEQREGEVPCGLKERWTTRPVASYGRTIIVQTPVVAHVSWDPLNYDWIALLKCGHVIPFNGRIGAGTEIPCERCTDGEPSIPLPSDSGKWLGEQVDEKLRQGSRNE